MAFTGIRDLKKDLRRYDSLVASGVVRPPLENEDPLADWPDIHLPAGTAARLVDDDRGETRP